VQEKIQGQLVELQQAELDKEFNTLLLESIDETITALLSRGVVNSLYLHLRTVHSISRDEAPRKLDTVVSILEGIFGLKGSKTICNAIARKFYARLDLEFYDLPSGTLLEYVEAGKIKLRGKNQGEEQS
jgi:hypothetical protein